MSNEVTMITSFGVAMLANCGFHLGAYEFELQWIYGFPRFAVSLEYHLE